jgi:opacity protein-like surface antigen
VYKVHRKVCAAVTIAAALTLLAPAAARADSLFGFHAGGFVVRGEDGRVDGDVLRENLSFLSFEIDDFNGFTFSGEYLLGLGDFVEVGVGVGYYASEVDSVYTDFTEADGTEIEQSTKVRIIPVPVTVRVFPIGRTTPVQPYVGGGVNFYSWRYSEFGEFINFADPLLPVFRDNFVDDGSAVGGTIVAGVRAPVSDRIFVGGELRWQQGSADLDPDLNFAGDRLDLGGFSYMGGVHVRF